MRSQFLVFLQGQPLQYLQVDFSFSQFSLFSLVLLNIELGVILIFRAKYISERSVYLSGIVP